MGARGRRQGSDVSPEAGGEGTCGVIRKLALGADSTGTAMTLPVKPALRQFSLHANLDKARLGNRRDSVVTQSTGPASAAPATQLTSGKPPDHLDLALFSVELQR